MNTDFENLSFEDFDCIPKFPKEDPILSSTSAHKDDIPLDATTPPTHTSSYDPLHTKFDAINRDKPPLVNPLSSEHSPSIKSSLDTIPTNMEIFQDEDDGLFTNFKKYKPTIFLVSGIFIIAVLFLILITKDKASTNVSSTLIPNNLPHPNTNISDNINSPASTLTKDHLEDLVNIMEACCTYARGEQLLLVTKTSITQTTKNLKVEINDPTILAYLESIVSELNDTGDKDTIFKYASQLNDYLSENYTVGDDAE